jgi:deoxycytidylate deaminase
MTKTERAYFAAAKAVSELSDHRIKMGCVVVNKHRIISSGSNSISRCHRLQAELDTERFGEECPGKLHSETSALLPLIRSGVDLSDAAIFVYRQHKDGTLAMARPCPSCERLIRRCGIKKIAFTVEGGMAVEKLNYE